MAAISSLSRRTFVKSAAAGATALAVPAIGQGLIKVSFTTSWTPEGPNLFAYVARDQGFWRKVGLDVSVARGSGSGAAAQTVGAGTFMFGMAATPVVIAQAARGLPLVSVAQINYDAIMGIGVLADSPIRKPKDLEGRKLGSSVTSGEYPFLGLYAQRAGFDLSKVSQVQLDSKVRDRSLIEKLVDGVSAFGSSTIPALASNGTELRFMTFRDAGIEFYGQSLITQQARVRNESSLVEAVVTGAMDAVKFAMTQPDDALAIFLKANEELAMTSRSKEYVRIGLGLTNLYNYSPEVLEQGFGHADVAKVRTQADLILKYGVSGNVTPPRLEELFTNRYTGKVRLSDADRARVQAQIAPFRKYVA
jgi:NitT/TauT family transport system substrate-binding protein